MCSARPALLGLLLLALVAGQTPAAAPATAPAGPVQPIPFSHKFHAGELKLACATCHTLSPTGDGFTIPQPPVCMACHQAITAAAPGLKELANYAANNQTIPWVRIYQVPSFVTFNHQTHLAAGNTCQDCHGNVAAQDQLALASDISMNGCLSCHTAKKAPTDCDTCHQLEQ